MILGVEVKVNSDVSATIDRGWRGRASCRRGEVNLDRPCSTNGPGHQQLPCVGHFTAPYGVPIVYCRCLFTGDRYLELILSNGR
jgi:hypothetical protein